MLEDATCAINVKQRTHFRPLTYDLYIIIMRSNKNTCIPLYIIVLVVLVLM